MLVKGAIVGHYKVGDMIGQGGMCSVYRGTHTLLGRDVAIKVLLAEHSEDAEVVNRFFNEARALTKLADPGIVQVFDYGHGEDGNPYIVMEFLEGEPMSRRLSRVRRFDLIECLRLARLMCTSLGVAHAKGIVHRDLKPDNIFLVTDPSVLGGERAKILDFGIAKISFDDHAQVKTRTNALIGTPMYMSPEQCNGAAGVDYRSDIYSMGCVMFAMLTGKPPFGGAGLGDVIAAHLREPPPLASSREPKLHPIVDAILDKCLRKAPATRFQSMADLARALGSVEQALSNPGANLDAMNFADVIGHEAVPEQTVNLRQASPLSPLAQGGPTLSGTTVSVTTLGGASGQSEASGAVRGARLNRRVAGLVVAATTLTAAGALLILGADDTANIASPAPIHKPAHVATHPDAMMPVDALDVDAARDQAAIDARDEVPSHPTSTEQSKRRPSSRDSRTNSKVTVHAP
jgi:eukaryotic-like serine/threonine-protein kinase